MEEIAKAIAGLTKVVASLKSDSNFIIEWFKAIGTLTAAAAAIVGIYKILKELKSQKQQFVEAQNLKEREQIIHKLNSFFGPLKELRAESKTMYDCFAKKEKEAANKIRKSDPNAKTFRTLRHLSEGKTLEPQDNAILEEIIKIGNKQLSLIEKEGHIISDTQLADLLGKLGAHIRFLTLAADHRLDYMSEILKHIVFPKEVDGALESEIRKLQYRYKYLMDGKAKKGKPYMLSEDNKATIASYSQDPYKYFQETAYIDLDEIYDKFLEKIEIGGLILDAGCGVGRDTRKFIKKGYKVVSFDASIEMVKFCNQYPFAYCMHKYFYDIDYVEEYDGVWACSSLIHLNHDFFVDALYKLAAALKPDGIFYFSLKKGKDKIVVDRKTIYFYDQKTIDNILVENLGFKLLEHWETSTQKTTDSSTWMNYLYQKTG